MNDLILSPQLRAAVPEWLSHLSALKDASDHTIEAYRRDVFTFLKFLTAHRGEETGLNAVLNASQTDLRSFMAARSASEKPSEPVVFLALIC